MQASGPHSISCERAAFTETYLQEEGKESAGTACREDNYVRDGHSPASECSRAGA